MRRSLCQDVGGGSRRNVERDALTGKGDLSKRISLSMTQPRAAGVFLHCGESQRLAAGRLGFAAPPQVTRSVRSTRKDRMRTGSPPSERDRFANSGDPLESADA